MFGQASQYQMRYATSPITELNWSQATPVVNLPRPKAAGGKEEITVSGLSSGVTYYFGIKAGDEENNWSPLSNVVTKMVCPLGCRGIRGNADNDPADNSDIADIAFLVQYSFGNGPEPECTEEADIDATNDISLTDVVYYTEWAFRIPPGPAPRTCPSSPISAPVVVVEK